MDNIFITPEHELLRDQIARFIAKEVEPFAAMGRRRLRAARCAAPQGRGGFFD